MPFHTTASDVDPVPLPELTVCWGERQGHGQFKTMGNAGCDGIPEALTQPRGGCQVSPREETKPELEHPAGTRLEGSSLI